MKKILDIETNNLLQTGLDYTSLPYALKEDYRLWCIVIRTVETNEVQSLTLQDCTKENLQAALADCTELIGHNIIGFDLPVLKLMDVLDYRIGYPGESSTVFGKETVITDTLLWSKLIFPDRLGGHSLEAWGNRLGNFKKSFHEFDKFTPEMLEYCQQDTSTNLSIYQRLMQDRLVGHFDAAYSMESKLYDLTLKQSLFGFQFDETLARQCLEDLNMKMQGIAAIVNPLVPMRKLTETEKKFYAPPKKQFKLDGSLAAIVPKYAEKIKGELVEVDGKTVLLFEGKHYEFPLVDSPKTTEVADIDNLDNLKGWLLSLGWNPSEWKERDITRNTDKSKKTPEQVQETIERYVKQTFNGYFAAERCELLGCACDPLAVRLNLEKKAKKDKPVWVPTGPKLTVGVDKTIDPALEALGEQASFVKELVAYLTYKHRRNSILGGYTGDEDDEEESETGYLKNIREDGRIATPADILGANTGRYKHKVVANIPRTTSLYGEQMRSMFKPGKKLWQLGFDFASLEARVQGHYCIPYTDGPALAEALIAEKPNDIHSLTARKMGISRVDAKSVNYACLPMHTEVLTVNGWKLYQDLVIGEALPTYNADTGKVELDYIKHKMHFTDKPVIKISDSYGSFESTEDHRWRVRSRKMLGSGKTAERFYVEDWKTTSELNSEDALLTTAAFVGGSSPIKPHEAELLGWLASDGYWKWSSKGEVTSSSGGKRKQCTMSISQAEHKYWRELEACLRENGAQFVQDTKTANRFSVKVYRLSSGWARGFLDRVLPERQNKHDVNWTALVTSLTREALEAFCRAFYYGDGNMLGEERLITQNSGKILDGITAAFLLLGSGRLYLTNKSQASNRIKSLRIGKRKHVGILRKTKENLGIQDTFCLTTTNGSFLIKQSGYIGITGNCLYGAAAPKLAKMLKKNLSEAENIYEAYWDSVPALRELKEKVEAYWESTGKKYIIGIDGRLLNTRSKHSLLNVLFQGAGAIFVKWAIIRISQLMEEKGILGDCFEDDEFMQKVWQMIVYHDEAQYAVHPALLDVKVFKDDEEAEKNLKTGCSAIGHGSKGPYIAYETLPVQCIREGIDVAQKELKMKVPLGFEYIVGNSWGQCH